MPEMQHFQIKETRTISVVANSISDAIAIAEAALTNGIATDGTAVYQPHNMWGHPTTGIKVTDISATRER